MTGEITQRGSVVARKRWDWKAIQTVVIAVATVFIAVATVVIAVATWVNVNVARDAFIAGTRAWLAPGAVEIPDNLLVQQVARTEVRLPYTNIGREPATKANVVFVAGTVEVPKFSAPQVMRATLDEMLGRECNPGQVAPTGMVVFPGTASGVVQAFSPEMMERINSRRYYALLAGCLIYETQGEMHRTRFCRILEPTTEVASTRDEMAKHTLPDPQ